MRASLFKSAAEVSAPDRLVAIFFVTCVLYFGFRWAVSSVLNLESNSAYLWFDFQIYLAFAYLLQLISRRLLIQTLVQLTLTSLFIWISIERIYRTGDYFRYSDLRQIGTFFQVAAAEHLTVSVLLSGSLLSGSLVAIIVNLRKPALLDCMALLPILCVLSVFHGLPPIYFKSSLRVKNPEFAQIIRASGKDIADRGIFLNFLVESVGSDSSSLWATRKEVLEAVASLKKSSGGAFSARPRGPATQKEVPPVRPPNIYVISQESLWDPAALLSKKDQLPEGYLAPDFAKLWRKNGSRYVLSPSYGGNTANYEFEILCGLPANLISKGVHFQDMLAKGPSCLPKVLSDRGYSTWAIHSGDAEFYNRQIVYRALGFEHVLFEADFDSSERIGLEGGGMFASFMSDESLFRQSLKRIKDLQASKKPFLAYMMTISGHTPFYFPRSKLPVQIDHLPSVRGMDPDKVRDAFNLNWYESHWLAQFVLAIHESDPTGIIVSAGDHLPGFAQHIQGPGGVPLKHSYASIQETPLLFIQGADPWIGGLNPLAYEIPGQLLRLAGITDGAAARFRWFQGPEGLRVRPLTRGALVFHPNGDSEFCEVGYDSRACERTSEWVSEVKVLLRDLWYGESFLASLKDE